MLKKGEDFNIVADGNRELCLGIRPDGRIWCSQGVCEGEKFRRSLRIRDLNKVNSDDLWRKMGEYLCREKDGEIEILELPAVPKKEFSPMSAFMDNSLLEFVDGDWRKFQELDNSKINGAYLNGLKVLERFGNTVFLGSECGLWKMDGKKCSDVTVGKIPVGYKGVSISECQGNNISYQAYGGSAILSMDKDKIYPHHIPLDFASRLPLIDTGKKLRYDFSDGKIYTRKIIFNEKTDFRWSSSESLGTDSYGNEWYRNYQYIGCLTGNLFKTIINRDRIGYISCASFDDEKIAIGADSGAYVYDICTGELIAIPGKDLDVKSIMLDGSTVWIGQRFKGLLRYSLATGRIDRWDVPGSKKDRFNNIIRGISLRDNILFMGTNAGVFSFEPDNERWEKWTDEFCESVFVDSMKNLWFGSCSGLLQYDFSLAPPKKDSAGEINSSGTSRFRDPNLCDFLVAQFFYFLFGW